MTEKDIILFTIFYLLGVLTGKSWTNYVFARKLQQIDSIIFEKHGFKPIKEEMLKVIAANKRKQK